MHGLGWAQDRSRSSTMRAQAFTSQFLSRPFPALALALAVAVAAAGIAAPVQASREASGADVVECKLPPQIRSLGRHATYLAAGRVVKIPVSECQVRGGTWSGGGPGALAGAAKIDGPRSEERRVGKEG